MFERISSPSTIGAGDISSSEKVLHNSKSSSYKFPTRNCTFISTIFSIKYLTALNALSARPFDCAQQELDGSCLKPFEIRDGYG